MPQRTAFAPTRWLLLGFVVGMALILAGFSVSQWCRGQQRAVIERAAAMPVEEHSILRIENAAEARSWNVNADIASHAFNAIGSGAILVGILLASLSASAFRGRRRLAAALYCLGVLLAMGSFGAQIAGGLQSRVLHDQADQLVGAEDDRSSEALALRLEAGRVEARWGSFGVGLAWLGFGMLIVFAGLLLRGSEKRS